MSHTPVCNQFELKRGQKTAGNRGLDLFVLDHRTGKERDVKTLSGGEAFVASLSMALGLADIVSANAAGVRIDTDRMWYTLFCLWYG